MTDSHDALCLVAGGLVCRHKHLGRGFGVEVTAEKQRGGGLGMMHFALLRVALSVGMKHLGRVLDGRQKKTRRRVEIQGCRCKGSWGCVSFCCGWLCQGAPTRCVGLEAEERGAGARRCWSGGLRKLMWVPCRWLDTSCARFPKAHQSPLFTTASLLQLLQAYPLDPLRSRSGWAG